MADDRIAEVLRFEQATRDLANEYPDGPGSDAVKYALLNAASGIAHVRKVLAQNQTR